MTSTTTMLDLQGPVGRLEGILMTPASRPLAAAVICHAHPLYGGTMNMKVVYHAAKALERRGVASLRFNFRGVGRSQGEHDQGRGEQEDVRAALDEMGSRFPQAPLLLGGFSFGSAMALRVACRHPGVKGVFCLGFPLSLVGDLGAMEGCKKPRLFVQCEGDSFGSGEALRAWVETLPEPRTLVVLRGGDHLFTGRLAALEKVLERWIDQRPWETTLSLDWGRPPA